MPDADTAQLQAAFMGEFRSALHVGLGTLAPDSQQTENIPLPEAARYPPDRFFGDPKLVELALDYLEAVTQRDRPEGQSVVLRALGTLRTIVSTSSAEQGEALQARAAAFAEQSPPAGEVRSLYGDRIPPDSRWLQFIDNLYFADFSKDDRDLLRSFIGQHHLYRIPLGRDKLRDMNDVVALELLLGLPHVRNPNSAHASALKNFLSQLFERFDYSVLNFRDNDSVAIADRWILDESDGTVRSDIRIFLDKPEDIVAVVKAMGSFANRRPFSQITIHFRGTEEEMLRLTRLTEPFMKDGPEGDRKIRFYQPRGPLHRTIVSWKREVVEMPKGGAQIARISEHPEFPRSVEPLQVTRSSSHQVTRRPSLVAPDTTALAGKRRSPALSVVEGSLAQVYFKLVRAGQTGLKDELQAIEMELTTEQRRELLAANVVTLVPTAERIALELSNESPSLPRHSPDGRSVGTKAGHTVGPAGTARTVVNPVLVK